MSTIENDPTDVDGEDTAKDKHRWDAKDLEKVTEFHEEKDEMNEISKESLGNLKVQPELGAKKIIIHKEDIQLITSELEVSKLIAEKKLIQHNGDVKAAMRDLVEM